MKLGMNNT